LLIVAVDLTSVSVLSVVAAVARQAMIACLLQVMPLFSYDTA
jgi:hypothetical protein